MSVYGKFCINYKELGASLARRYFYEFFSSQAAHA
jgi:hypothetical protein